MSTLPQISEAQWDQLLAFVDKATGVAAYISRKLAVFQWLALVSGLVLGFVIYQMTALQPWVAALVFLAVLLPALVIFQARKRLQQMSHAPQAVEDMRKAVAGIPDALREAGVDVQNRKLTPAGRGGVFATLKQLRVAKQAAGDMKSRFQAVGSPDFLASLLTIVSPLFLLAVLFSVVATVALLVLAVFTTAGCLLSQ